MSICWFAITFHRWSRMEFSDWTIQKAAQMIWVISINWNYTGFILDTNNLVITYKTFQGFELPLDGIFFDIEQITIPFFEYLIANLAISIFISEYGPIATNQKIRQKGTTNSHLDSVSQNEQNFHNLSLEKWSKEGKSTVVAKILGNIQLLPRFLVFQLKAPKFGFCVKSLLRFDYFFTLWGIEGQTTIQSYAEITMKKQMVSFELSIRLILPTNKISKAIWTSSK